MWKNEGKLKGVVLFWDLEMWGLLGDQENGKKWEMWWFVLLKFERG